MRPGFHEGTAGIILVGGHKCSQDRETGTDSQTLPQDLLIDCAQRTKKNEVLSNMKG